MKQKYVQEWELSRTFPTRTVGQLIRLFYKIHKYKDRGVWRAMAPITFLVNPAPFVMPGDPFAQDMYLAIYHGLTFAPRARFYVTVEQNIHKPNGGPHPAKLCLQVYGGASYQTGKVVWLGATQIEGNFYDEDKIKVQLRRAIRLGTYYASEKASEEVIEFDEPIRISYSV